MFEDSVIYTPDNYAVLEIFIEMSPDISIMTRNVYSLLEFLGDIGGLFDMLRYIGQFIIFTFTAISGSQLNQYIIANLFEIEN